MEYLCACHQGEIKLIPDKKKLDVVAPLISMPKVWWQDLASDLPRCEDWQD